MLKLKIGTRKSPLAIAQANWVRDRLRQHYSNCQIQVVSIKTAGDQMKAMSISQIGGKGLFVKEIEKAVLEGEIDLAVHSMKDLPMELPRGLIIAAITKREDPFDVFVSKSYPTLEDLPPQSTIATGSLRRRVQLLHYRRDLIIKEIRGNVDTRIRKLNRGFAEGLVLAAAALRRMKQKGKITQYLHPDICLPAAGQGALGIEIRAEDKSLKKRLAILNDVKSVSTITAERSCLRNLGVSCHTPATAYGEINGGAVLLRGLVASLDGKIVIRKKILGQKKDAKILGEFLAKKILGAGGKELLAQFSREQ
jgi:hydroxymethylbilane synthase